MAKTKTTQTKKTNVFDTENALTLAVNDDLTILVNPCPTIEEKLGFVQSVIDGIYINERVYHTLLNARFLTLFFVMFTNFEFPDELKGKDGTMNIEVAYNHIRHISWSSIEQYNIQAWERSDKTSAPPSIDIVAKISLLWNELRNDVQAQIELENQKLVALNARNIALEETLENVNFLVQKGIELLTSFSPDTLGEIVKGIPGQFLPTPEPVKTLDDVINAISAAWPSMSIEERRDVATKLAGADVKK